MNKLNNNDESDSKKDTKSDISENNQYNEYDKYDIIDFLESDYLEYLNLIPNSIWFKYKKDIEIKLLEVNNPQVINLILNKINIDTFNYFKSKNLEKINLELFKILTKRNKEKIINKLIKQGLINDLYSTIFKYQNLDFIGLD